MSQTKIIEIPLKKFVVEALKKMEDNSDISVEVIKEALHFCCNRRIFKKLFSCRNVIFEYTPRFHMNYGPFFIFLRLSSLGTYLDYLENKEYFPQFEEEQLTKLRNLTILRLANKMKIIPYDVLFKEFKIDNVKDLKYFFYPDIVIEKDNCLEVVEVNWPDKKDVEANDLDKAINILEKFCEVAVKMFFPQYKLVPLMLIKVDKQYDRLKNAVLLLRMNC